MKAHEVLTRYKAGDRDFTGENLRGQSFKGKNLSGVNFSKADIRGANFTNAKLTGANFSRVQAGLQRRWAMALVSVSWILSALSALFSGFLGYVVAFIFDKDTSAAISGWFALIVLLVVFFIITIRKGLVAGLVTFAVGVAGDVAVVGDVAVAGVGAGAVAVGVAGAAGISGAVAVGVAVGVAGAVGISGAVAGAVARAVAGAKAGAAASAVACAVAGAVALLNAYISWRALKGDERDAWIRRFAIAFAATGGTSFRGADLTDADFTSATLKSTDFRNATLTCTRWHQAKKLDRVRPGNTYLTFPQVRQLLITGQGQTENFDYQPLRGVNLKGANLADASFIGADLSEANLQDVDLSRAKLVQTQLDETDLTGATLTGAYIEDWGITSHTKLHGVRCEYVFMREPTKEDPNPRRKPDNWNESFTDGDFADFIKPIVDTLDLYHNQDVDPRAIAISFKQLAENHPEAKLEIVAMEKRGGNKFLLRAATAPDANHSELNAEYFDTYNKIKALAEREIQALLAEKDSRISSLENMVATALQRPSFYAKTYQNQGVIMSERKTGSGDINISGGNFAGVGSFSGDNSGTFSGTQNISQSEQRQTLTEAAAEIQQLLKQLEQTNPTATEVEQKAFLTAAIPPTKRERFVNALQAGGKELFKELMDNMYVNTAIAAIEGWQSAK